MKMVAAIMMFALALIARGESSPIGKVIQMISDLEVKVISEGKESQRVYETFAEFCEDRSKELNFEISTEKKQVQTLKAVISEEAAVAESLSTKIDELSGEMATDEADLKAATAIRQKESKDFAKAETDLKSVIDTLARAIGVLEKEMAKGGSSMLQLRSARNMAQSLRVMVDASMITSADSTKLTALLQSNHMSDESDSDTGAPDPAVYKSKGGDIVEVMQGLFEKAESQLADLRQTEESAMHNYKMLKQSLESSMKNGKKEMAETKQGIAQAEEKKSAAEGDLTVTTKDLAGDVDALGELHSDCMARSSDFESETKSRGEELKALAEAKSIIKEATSASLSQTSLLQIISVASSKITSQAQLANFEAVQFVRRLAKKQKSAELMQLAQRMAAAMSYARSGEDPFAKIKGMIQDMIGKLEAAAEADSSKKAYCDKENAESVSKKDAKEAEIEKLTTSIDGMSARSATLKDEVATLSKELGEIATAQAKMDTLRQEEKTLFNKNKAEMDKAINGVKQALKVLSDYYAKDDKAHASAEGAGASIISLLEVCESDFTKGLAEMTGEEESAAAEYDKETKENEITKVTKEKDVKYKTKESKALDKAISEEGQDLTSVREELEAVLEYLARLKGKCFPLPPETYEEKAQRRVAEIDGLKQALKILDGEAVLLQRMARRNNLRHGSM